MSGKWTPGPWHCHRNSEFWEFGSDERGQLGDVCASAFNGNGMNPDAEEVMEANARLIAAAPELAEAVQIGMKDLLTAAHWAPAEYSPAFMATYTQMKRALAKAKGEGA